MNRPDTRRGFLSGLTTLPLIGGSVALIGSPSAVAAPITQDLLLAYADWLILERRVLLHEVFPDPALRRFAKDSLIAGRWTETFHMPEGQNWRTVAQPSTRAALVLSTVGADLRRAGA